MTRVIISLYDHPDRATEVMTKLHEAGFQTSQIMCIESSPEEQRFYRRGPLTDSENDVITSDHLRRELDEGGLEDRQIDDLIRQLRGRRSLVVVESSDELSGRAMHLMNAYPAEEVDEQSSYDEQAREHNRQADDQRQSQKRGATTSDIHKVPAQDKSRDKPKTTPGPKSKKRRHPASEELQSSRAQERFKIYKPDFRRHYEEHYAAMRRYSFEDYTRAYRYGLALATDKDYRHYDWPRVEPDAEQQWKARMAEPWKDFREAVRFGWYRIRGEEEKFAGRPRRL